MRQVKFSFEDLSVWQKAVELSKEIINLIENVETERKHYRLIKQLELAVISVPLNIAEGVGHYSKNEFMRFLYVARGSLYETVTLLIIFKNNNWITIKQLENLKIFCDTIGKMLSGLITYIKLRSSPKLTMN